jgi:hypothetical protein
MAIDLFGNNTSNDYIYPTLAECAGNSDSATFEFLPNDQVGIISGSDIILSMGLGDISQPVTGWVQQTKLLQPGEVIFIQGLTKGISSRVQVFPFDGSVAYEESGSNHQYYLSVDMSINYYKNFRYYQDVVRATGDYTNGVTIETALDIAFDAKGILVNTTYDVSGLTFTGTTAGYAYNITALNASLFEVSYDVGESLIEDTSSAIAAFKYPNSAMLGYVLKVTYPSTSEDEEKYIKINHVPDNLVYFEASTGNSSCWVRYEKSVDVGLSGASCTGDTLSAAEYLDKVETNNEWEKIGVLRIWLTAEDPESSNIENLITGFYAYNPQSFAVQIDYMTIL